MMIQEIRITTPEHNVWYQMITRQQQQPAARLRPARRKVFMGGAFTGVRRFFSGSFYDKIFMILNPYGTVGPEHG